ncbi:serine/threonine-protein kinase 3 [Elysia marginata]|uniref:Serine/threonine-protein kinase 3 n=1 Tax=Elysia marginata TaxID=1093978 RepID=A0AAV4ET99_9GAST|nr:serine/threonine-protein kinase 3 [Elysia marginata]
MVINADSDSEDGTMKRHSTASGGKEQYRPSYLDHFDKQDQEKQEKAKNAAANAANNSNSQQQQQQQQQSPRHSNQQQQSQQQALHQQHPKQITPPHHFQRPYLTGLENVEEQLRNLSVEDLELRLTDLDPEMEREIEELRARYQAKRQPILDAIDAKKKRQQNF